MIEDVDIIISLQERGKGGGVSGSVDNGIGDRAIEQARRISGADMLHKVFVHIIDAIRHGGWDDGDEINAVVEKDSIDDKDGRDWSLRGALARAILTVEAANPDAELADQMFYDDNHPNEAITFTNGNKCLIVSISYISDGNTSDGVNELVTLLQSYGVRVTGS